MIKLYLITRRYGSTPYDTYRGAVVGARSRSGAACTHPGTGLPIRPGDWKTRVCDDWVRSPGEVRVKELGSAKPSVYTGVVLSDFNAA